MLKLVPFNAVWITHDKLDLKAIYRRPSFKDDEFGEPARVFDKHGLPAWDITTPLPIKHHNRWAAKGFEYVTLADRADLVEAAKKGTLPEGASLHEFAQDPRTGGPWNYKKYTLGQERSATTDAAKMREQVERFGSEAYLEIRRELDPLFALPPDLRDVLPGGRRLSAEDSGDQPHVENSRQPKVESTTTAPALTAQKAGRGAKKPTKKGASPATADTELVGGFTGGSAQS